MQHRPHIRLEQSEAERLLQLVQYTTAGRAVVVVVSFSVVESVVLSLLLGAGTAGAATLVVSSSVVESAVVSLFSGTAGAATMVVVSSSVVESVVVS
jgi:hypothetical protein